MDNDLIYKIAITLLPGFGDVNIKKIISHLGSAKEVFTCNPTLLTKINGIGEKTIASLKNKNILNEADQIIQQSIKQNTKLIFYTDNEYPHRLRNHDDSPCLLYTKGNIDLNTVRTIGIVGTRNCTSYGRDITQKIVSELTKYSPLVISGLAYGIDYEAHKACVQYDIPTLGVMANGIDIIYPAAHKKTVLQMLEKNGGILTENTFGQKPDAHRFPARNRIIAGLSDVLLVVETAEKGGTLITAEIAYSYNKEIFAVPGNVGQPYSSGSNKLIKQLKASIFTNVDDMAIEIGWTNELNKKQKIQQLSLLLTKKLGVKEKAIIDLLKDHKDMHLELISRNTLIPINELIGILLELEFNDLIAVVPGQKYRLKV